MATAPPDFEADLHIATQNASRLLREVPPALLAEDKSTGESLKFENTSVKNKMGRVLMMAKALSQVAEPYVACKKGCCACCHDPVPISELEAQRLSACSQRPAKPFNQVHRRAPDFYRGSPCPFLSEGTCSVYEQRPYVCRTRLAFTPDAVWCQQAHADKEARLPAVILPGTQEAYIHLVTQTQSKQLFDIREVFGP